MVNSPTSASPKKKGSVRVKPGSDRFRSIVHPLNLDPDLRFGSGNSLNLGPNLGPVQAGSGSNRGSEPDRGITISSASMCPPLPPSDHHSLCPTAAASNDHQRVLATRWWFPRLPCALHRHQRVTTPRSWGP